MKKSKIIKEIVGERLKRYGFKYYRTESVMVEFEREVEGFVSFYDPSKTKVKQYVFVQNSRFDEIVTIRICTDAYGNEAVKEIVDLNHKSEFPEFEGGWIRYSDEESYRTALVKLADAFEKYGLDLLTESSIEEPVIPTKEMAWNLYENHKVLDEEFKKEFGINTETEKDVDKWFDVAKKAILSVEDRTYEEAKDMLVKTAAFLGERGCEVLEQKWKFPPHLKTPMTVDDRFKYPACKALIVAVMLWKHKCAAEYWYLIKEYEMALKKELSNSLSEF